VERALAELGAAPPLGAVCLLVANDHGLKRLFHNALTGKLSDVAICFLLPLLVSAALGLVSDWSGRRRLAAGGVVATLVFTLLELSDAAGSLFGSGLGVLGLGPVVLTRDPTDLLALVCVPLAVAYGRRRLTAAEHGPNVWRAATGALVMATGSIALMADSSVVPPCDVQSVPVTFQAEAGCGDGGIFVVGRNPPPSTWIEISNPTALGLPPDANTPALGDYGPDGYGGCPIQFDQSWGLGVYGWVTVKCGAQATDCPSGVAQDFTRLRACTAMLTNGAGWFNCTVGYTTTPLCSSRLRVIRVGGDDGGGADTVDTSADGGASDAPIEAAATDQPADGGADTVDDSADGGASDAPIEAAATDQPADGGAF
jgi:hypothetical protein